MKTRLLFLVSGAVGVALAALVYSLAVRAQELVGHLVPWRQAEAFVFMVLLGTALAEIPLMVYGLRTLRGQKLHPLFVYAVNTFYVAFAGFYALVQVLMFGASILSEVLVALCALRLASDLVIGGNIIPRSAGSS